MLAKHDIKSLFLCHQEKSTVTFHMTDATGLRMPYVYSINAARFILEKVVDLLKLESNNTIDKYG